MTTARDHFAQLLSYNSWANQRLFGAITAETLDVPQTSSFPTIRRTVLHICDAEWVWFERVNGRNPGDVDLELFDGPFDEALRRMKQQTDDWIAHVASLSDDELHEVIHYRMHSGVETSQRFDEILLHVCNHATFHRGQVVTMLRAAGVTTIPGTDLILYYRQQN